jgi:hypothetical protein
MLTASSRRSTRRSSATRKLSLGRTRLQRRGRRRKGTWSSWRRAVDKLKSTRCWLPSASLPDWMRRIRRARRSRMKMRREGGCWRSSRGLDRRRRSDSRTSRRSKEGRRTCAGSGCTTTNGRSGCWNAKSLKKRRTWRKKRRARSDSRRSRTQGLKRSCVSLRSRSKRRRNSWLCSRMCRKSRTKWQPSRK